MVRMKLQIKKIVILQSKNFHLKTTLMKRLILFVFVLSFLAFYGFAQSIVISNLSGVLPTNASCTQMGTHDCVELLTFFNVKTATSHTLNVFCKKVHLSMMDSTETTMCWAGGCYPSWVNVSPTSQAIEAGATQTDFVGHYSWTGTSQP